VLQDTLDNHSRLHLKYTPGAMNIYSNDSFTLAEIIVERVSGQKFIDFLAEIFFSRSP